MNVIDDLFIHLCLIANFARGISLTIPIDRDPRGTNVVNPRRLFQLVYQDVRSWLNPSEAIPLVLLHFRRVYSWECTGDEQRIKNWMGCLDAQSSSEGPGRTCAP